MHFGWKEPAALALAIGIAYGRGSVQETIPLRQLAPAVASDSNVLTEVSDVRCLSDGRVVVNDRSARRVLIFDSTLSAPIIVMANDVASTGGKYGAMPGRILAARSDTTVFVDREAGALVLISARGTLARSIAPPASTDLTGFLLAAYGQPSVDPLGRFIYRGGILRRESPTQLGPAPDSGRLSFTVFRDSSPILRADLDRRTVDTIAKLALPVATSVRMGTGGGNSISFAAYNPLPLSDDWTLLPDGTVAVVRAHDYHIDWIRSDGTTEMTPPMPFDWRRIATEEKVRIVDSVKKYFTEQLALQPPPPRPPGVRAPPPPVPFTTVDAAELPDYYPPTRAGQIRADPSGNVWILPTTSVLAGGGGLVWDVVNRRGQIAERVLLPKGRNLVGVGSGGVVYMSFSSRPGHVRLERAQVTR